jgi:hypothetical protein
MALHNQKKGQLEEDSANIGCVERAKKLREQLDWI